MRSTPSTLRSNSCATCLVKEVFLRGLQDDNALLVRAHHLVTEEMWAVFQHVIDSSL